MRLFEFTSRQNPFVGEMWHGTNAHFSKFNQKMARVQNDLYGGGVGYFTDSLEVAKSYALSSLNRKGVKPSAEPYMYKVMLNIENVFDVTKTYDGEMVRSFLKSDSYEAADRFIRSSGLARYGVDLDLMKYRLINGDLPMKGDNLFDAIGDQSKSSSKGRDTLIKAGFDGLTHPGGLRGGTKGLHTVIIAYEAKDITILENYKLTV